MRIKPHSTGYGSPVGTAARTLQRVGNSDWVERLGRIGLVAKGISFALVGVLALLVAFDAGGAATDRHGAFRWLSEQPYGFVALLGIAFGFGAYAVWRFAQAFLDRDDEGKDFGGWAKRAGCLAKGVFYGGLSLIAISFLTGPRGDSANERERTAQVFEWPLGRWLVGAFGVALVCYGLWNGYRSITGKYRKHLEEGKIHRENVSPLVNAAGVLGHAVRLVLFGMVGAFLVRAAYQYDPKEAIGLDGALAKLAHQPGGTIWLGACAAGLFAYGLFSILQARYRDI
jgi:hypothetical protein